MGVFFYRRISTKSPANEGVPGNSQQIQEITSTTPTSVPESCKKAQPDMDHLTPLLCRGTPSRPGKEHTGDLNRSPLTNKQEAVSLREVQRGVVSPEEREWRAHYKEMEKAAVAQGFI